MDEKNDETAPKKTRKISKQTLGKLIKILSVSALTVVAAVAAYLGYLYVMSPDVIRNPQMEHYHFRMQIIVDGKAEDFGGQGYQVGYSKDQCNANLVEQPIHFHDNMDQFVHIHWRGMTGGMVMKYYGWNYIGGLRNSLGYKLNDLADIQEVTIHGSYLPDVTKDTKFYIYTGDDEGYTERTFDDWRDKDLEEFFGKESNFPKPEEVSLLDILFPPAYAHGTADDADGDDGTETEEEKLTRINNLLGNVVIFVQSENPTDTQIKAKFANLVPLTDSTCGG